MQEIYYYALLDKRVHLSIMFICLIVCDCQL